MSFAFTQNLAVTCDGPATLLHLEKIRTRFLIKTVKKGQNNSKFVNQAHSRETRGADAPAVPCRRRP